MAKKVTVKVSNPTGLSKYLATFKHSFEAKPGSIDMRTMSKNYSDGVIPWQDINRINEFILGPAPSSNKFDPRLKPDYTLDLCWEPFSKFGILSEIQRDEIPSHLYNLEMHFDSKKISVILAMEDPVTGLICPFDGHHTARELDRQGWTHAPCYVLRPTPELLKGDLMEARRQLMLVAGEAFLSINLTVKKGVSGYDQFIIRRDFGDPDAIAMDNIIKSHNCTPVRASKDPGDISHYVNLWTAYELQDRQFNQGRYLDMALAFHVYTWPNEVIYPAVMVGLALFFHKCERAKVTIDKTFVDDLRTALKNTYKLSKFTDEGYKKDYQKAHPYGDAKHDIIMACGFAHTYNKHVGKVKLYTPELHFKVK